MRMLYSAYGLLLDSSFPIEGMTSAARHDSDRLPALLVDQRDPAELQEAWSPSGAEPEWHGRLGDGFDFVIERGAGDELLFSYGDRARFRLQADMSRLDCAPIGKDLDWQRVLISKVIPSISVMRGYEALHAASVDSPQGVVAIMAPSGIGKSTLAGELLGRGWPLFADDQLTLGRSSGAIRAYPGTPHMNFPAGDAPGADPESLGSTIAILGGERWVSVRALTPEPRPVRLLCLLERGSDLPLRLCTLDSNPLLLAPYMLGLSMDAERQRTRFDLYADLMDSVALVRLTGGIEHGPEQFGDLIDEALAQASEPATAGAR